MQRQPDKTDIHVGTRIRMRRIERKISQSELGDALGVSFQQVQKYEKGVNRVGAGRLQQIATALECTTNFFFEGMPGKQAGGDTSAMTSFMTSPYGAAIAQAFVSLPASGNLRRNVRDVIVGIAAFQANAAGKPSRARAA